MTRGGSINVNSSCCVTIRIAAISRTPSRGRRPARKTHSIGICRIRGSHRHLTHDKGRCRRPTARPSPYKVEKGHQLTTHHAQLRRSPLRRLSSLPQRVLLACLSVCAAFLGCFIAQSAHADTVETDMQPTDVLIDTSQLKTATVADGAASIQWTSSETSAVWFLCLVDREHIAARVECHSGHGHC